MALVATLTMPFNADLAARIRRVLPPDPAIAEQKMFGGIAFLLRGKMFIGVTSDDLMVRLGADGEQAALKRPHVRPMDFTGRPLKGFVYVGSAGTRTDKAVAAWARQAMAFVATLPASRKPKRRRTSPARASARGGKRAAPAGRATARRTSRA